MTPRTRNVLLLAGVFAVALAGLALTSWNHLLQPSANFHFIDLGESFLAGRLDTDTPLRKQGQLPLPDDPPGLQDAVDRSWLAGGWNDWVSYWEVVLRSGERFQGVWPWQWRKPGEANYDLKNRFVLLSGDYLELDRRTALREVCLPEPGPREEPAVRLAWETRDKWAALAGICVDPKPEQLPSRSCPAGTRRTPCKVPHYFVSFPPFPALLMLPLTALLHYDLNDVWLTLVIAALNALLLFVLLRALRERGYLDKSVPQLLVFVFLFTFGTVNYFSGIRGEVWFTALMVGVGCSLAYLYFATELRSPFLAGLFLACGFATRTPLAFASVYFGLQVLLQKRPWDRAGVWLRVRQLAWFALPCVVVGVLLMMYNLARFESPFEFGHRFLAEGTRPTVADHGLFSFSFLVRNLKVAFLNLPKVIGEYPYLKVTGHGLSLLVTTPALLYLVWPRRDRVRAASRERFHLSLHTMLWVTVVATALPGLMYQNTGWFQFGYRFALDYLPMLVVLLALDARKPGKVFVALVLLGFLVNLFGAVTFGRFTQFYY